MTERANGLDVVVVRPFNHIGANMNSKLALASFALQIASIERGESYHVCSVFCA